MESNTGVTVIWAVALIVPTEALMVVVPTLRALTIPALPAALLIVATDGEDELQITG